jgi:hypothetical protein
VLLKNFTLISDFLDRQVNGKRGHTPLKTVREECAKSRHSPLVL